MPTEILKPNTHLKLRYTVSRRRRFEFRVEASNAVSTYIVNDDGFAAFETSRVGVDTLNDDIPASGGFLNRREHHQDLVLPSSGTWWLLIVNDQDEDVGVHYEVYI